MTDLSGITITPGVLPPAIRTSLASAVDRVGAKLIDNVRIDTTHFVCTEGRGAAWEKAVEMNIPVVRPEWIEGCEREGTIVSVRGYYLNADPKTRQIGQGAGLQQPASHVRSASSTVSGGRESQSNLSPRPGGESAAMNPLPEVPNGTKDDEESEVPPTPPPKHDTTDPKNDSSKAEDAEDSDDEDQSDNEKHQADGYEAPGSSARSSESETTPEKEPGGSNDTQGSQPPQPSTSDTSVDVSQKSGKNGNGTEGDLDEVPL